jgi:hypothetical protein
VVLLLRQKSIAGKKVLLAVKMKDGWNKSLRQNRNNQSFYPTFSNRATTPLVLPYAREKKEVKRFAF